MSELKATGGPYKADRKLSWSHVGIRVMGGDIEVARVPLQVSCTAREGVFPAILEFEDGGKTFTTDEEAERLSATAHLIAASWEMYRALKGLLEIGKRDLSNPKYDGHFEAAIAACAKAEGVDVQDEVESILSFPIVGGARKGGEDDEEN